MKKTLAVAALSAAALAAGAMPVSADPVARYLISDPAYVVWDHNDDDAIDSGAFPELKESAMMISKSSPKTLSVAVLASPYTSASDTYSGLVRLDIDTNGDGTPEYTTRTPQTNFALSTLYTSTVVQGGVGDTAFTATWMRSDTGWIVSIPWYDMGLTQARYRMKISNSGGTDYAPNSFGTMIPLSLYTPPPAAPAAPEPAAPAAAAWNSSCSTVNAKYPGGVAKNKKVKNKAGKKFKKFKKKPMVSASLYKQVKKLDRDKDGIACEK